MVTNDDSKILLLRTARLRTRILNFCRRRRALEVRNLLSTILSLLNGTLLRLGTITRSVCRANGLTRSNGLTIESMDRICLTVRERRIVLTRKRRVGILRSSRLIMFLLGRNVNRRLINVLVMTTNRCLRHLNCTREDLSGSFALYIFARRLRCFLVISYRFVRSLTGFYF